MVVADDDLIRQNRNLEIIPRFILYVWYRNREPVNFVVVTGTGTWVLSL